MSENVRIQNCNIEAVGNNSTTTPSVRNLASLTMDRPANQLFTFDMDLVAGAAAIPVPFSTIANANFAVITSDLPVGITYNGTSIIPNTKQFLVEADFITDIALSNPSATLTASVKVVVGELV